MVDNPDGAFKIPLHALLNKQEKNQKPKQYKYDNEAFDKEDDFADYFQQKIFKSFGKLGLAETVIRNVPEEWQ
jgi:hypothetical protein